MAVITKVFESYERARTAVTELEASGVPTSDISLIADPEKNFLVIMKDGKVYKNTLPTN